ncbi:MarR family winged helix-turn-helix transcriptional regulator [Deinococcus roseus]|uniref:MarR family transcriptional regulator n=1 Tax=Deinococcus roseus TaxID=392414 RepID=A0ABQ2D1B1_9DEIO|nr:MarR family transcriptional regulator [Deinococcus roseus]GGJ41242.1 MarR family transcriptional regulator [Deinococcus roseus]
MLITESPDPMPEDFPTEFDTPQDNPGFLLWTITSRWQRHIRQALDPLNLTHAQFVLLASLGWLCTREQHITQTRLADHAHMDPMTTSQVLRTLEQKGWVTRLAHPRDTRARVLQVTAAGTEMIEKSIPLVEAVDRAFFAGLSPEAVALFRKLDQQSSG